MKQIGCFLMFILLLTTRVAAYNGNIEVHITDTGNCYHEAGCGALRSDIPVPLRYAVEHGYLPCDRCNPPLPDFKYTAIEKREKSSSSGNGNNMDPDPEQQEQKRKEEQERKEAEIRELERRRMYVFFRNAILLFIGIPACFFFYYNRAQNSQKREEEYALAEAKKQELEQQQEELRRKREQQLIQIELNRLSQLEKKRSEYRKLYEGKSVRELAGVPEGIWFDENDYPHSEDKLLESRFTVYITPSGSSYHLSSCSSARSGRPVHICFARSHGKGPCSRCHPMADIPQWAKEYQRITWICREFKIDVKA